MPHSHEPRELFDRAYSALDQVKAALDRNDPQAALAATPHLQQTLVDLNLARGLGDKGIANTLQIELDEARHRFPRPRTQ